MQGSSTPKEYRRRAAECQQIAAETSSADVRDTMLHIASRWLPLAEEEEEEVKSPRAAEG
jgi:hypothetical protein